MAEKNRMAKKVMSRETKPDYGWALFRDGIRLSEVKDTKSAAELRQCRGGWHGIPPEVCRVRIVKEPTDGHD